MFGVRQDLKLKGFSDDTVDIILNSWRTGTEKQYAPVLKQWFSYCRETINPYNPPLHESLNFLATLFQKGYSYDQLKNARSALSAVINASDNISFGKLPMVKRFMKGVFEKRPSFPKNYFIWDVSIVFNHFRNLPKVEDLTLKQLSKKLALLMSIASGGQRAQTLHLIKVANINILPDEIIIPITDKVKQTKPSKHMAPLQFKKFHEEPSLCVVENLLQYKQKTEHLRQCPNLFVSYIKPHKAVSSDTISRWCKGMLSDAGITPDLFTPHSSRSAASSKSLLAGIPICDILKHAGWRSERTFASRYNKVVIEDVNVLRSLRDST